ncbi:MAG: hypothetical protein RMX68_011355 [Aulosira sp. ZfuVER01]
MSCHRQAPPRLRISIALKTLHIFGHPGILSLSSNRARLGKASPSNMTHIADRERFTTVPNRENHVLVRARIDRRLVGKTQSLYTYLNTQPSEGTYSVDVPADPRIGRTTTEANSMLPALLLALSIDEACVLTLYKTIA